MPGLFFFTYFASVGHTKTTNTIPVADQTTDTPKATATGGPTLSTITFIRKGEEVLDNNQNSGAASADNNEAATENQTDNPQNSNNTDQSGGAENKAGDTQADKGAPAGGETAGTEQTTQNQEPQEYTEEDFHNDVNDYLSTSTGGAVKTPADISKLIAENKDLKIKLQHKEPDFPNETAKKVYELATKAVGMELTTARQLFHVMALDLSTMSAKEKQFEAFCLDRPNVSREEARKRFEAKYDKDFSDLEDVIQLDNHEIATRDAENKIKETQKNLTESVKQGGEQTGTGQQEQQQFTAEQQAQVEASLKSALDVFAGVRLKFDDSKYGNLEIPMDRGKASEFMEFLKDPQKAIQDRIAERSKDEHGNFSYDRYVAEAFAWFNRDLIEQKTQEHLMNLGRITEIQERKNTPKKTLTEQQTTPVKKDFKQTMLEAVKGAGLAG